MAVESVPNRQGRLVIGDAMFCQRDFCQQVIDARGDYKESAHLGLPIYNT